MPGETAQAEAFQVAASDLLAARSRNHFPFKCIKNGTSPRSNSLDFVHDVVGCACV